MVKIFAFLEPGENPGFRSALNKPIGCIRRGLFISPPYIL